MVTSVRPGRTKMRKSELIWCCAVNVCASRRLVTRLDAQVVRLVGPLFGRECPRLFQASALPVDKYNFTSLAARGKVRLSGCFKVLCHI